MLSRFASNAEKLGKRLSQAQRQAAQQAANDDDKQTRTRERNLRRFAQRTHTSFKMVEQGLARAFGSKTTISGGIGDMARRTGDGFGALKAAFVETGEGAGVMEAALGTVAGTIAAVGAAAVIGTIAVQKFGASWAEQTAKVSRFATTMGVGKQALQEFMAAAEQMGMDKGAAQGAMGSLSETLNDAKYGRNGQARDMLRRTGIQFQMNKDGSVNTDAMVPAIADAIKRQNSSGRRTLARAWGIPMEAIPVFAQGGKALSDQMTDAGRYANVQSDQNLSDAERLQQKNTRLSQIKDRVEAQGGHFAATSTEGLLDGELSAARTFADAVSGNFKPAVNALRDAAKGFGDAVDHFLLATNPLAWTALHTIHRLMGGKPDGQGGAQAAPVPTGNLPDSIERNGEQSRQGQVSPKGAVGVMQLLPSTAQMVARRTGIPWDPWRFRTDEAYNRDLGQKYVGMLAKKYRGDQTLAAAAYNAGEGNVDNWIRTNGDPRKGHISDAQWAERIPFRETRDYVHRVIGGVAMQPTPTNVHLLVEARNLPPGTRFTARSDKGAVSQSIPN